MVKTNLIAEFRKTGFIYLGYLKFISIGTPKTINFPFVPNGKLMVFRFSNI